jgi:3-methyladenine DNA glycosylase AlkD
VNSIVERIRKTLKENIDENTLANLQRFFKESVKCYGARMPECTKIARQFWPEVQKFKKSEIFELCELLLVSDYCEEVYIISSWLPKMVGQFVRSDGFIFKGWIEKYINNWAKCDSFCNHTIGDYVMKFPEFIDELKEWALSDNRWVRRAAAVSLIIPARKGHFLNDIFEISDRLLFDKDDLVQKGYGWMLKAASEAYQKEVYEYVLQNKEKMPRTSLRYAIEKMPDWMKKEAMKR